MARPMKKLSDFDKKLGSVVRSKRVKVGLTRAQLAELTGIAEANLMRRWWQERTTFGTTLP